MECTFFKYCFLVSLLVVGSYSSESEFKLDEGVLVLSKADFPKAIESVEHLLVEFCKFHLFICHARTGVKT